jgi:translation elongation factor EF-1alpha
MQIIENLPLPKRMDTKPIRFSINSIYHLNNEKGMFISGKVEGGIIEEKEKLVLLPHEIKLGIRKIIRNSSVV